MDGIDIRFAFPLGQLPWWLGLTAVIIAMVAAALRRLEARREKRLHRFVEAALAPRLLAGYDARVRRPLFGLILAGCMFLALTFAQPRWGKAWVEVKRGSRDILVLLDVSESMNAAPPLPSRLERARQKIASLLELYPGDRFGLVVFSGAAVLQCPLTLDLGYFRSILSGVDTGTLTEEGTDLAAAFEEAERVFHDDIRQGGERNRDTRAIVLISDGEEVSGDGLEAARRLRRYAGLYVLGVGDKRGGEVACPGWMKELTPVRGTAQTHLTRLDERTLSKIALEGNGVYVRSTPDNADLRQIKKEFEALSARVVSGEARFTLVNRYRWPLAAAMACFAAEALWMAIMPWIRRWRLRASPGPAIGLRRSRRSQTSLLLAVFLALAAQASAESLGRGIERVDAALQTGAPENALAICRELQVEYPDAEAVAFGIGCAHYATGEAHADLGDTEKAAQSFEEARAAFEPLLASEDTRLRAHAAFNAATCVARLAKMQETPGQYQKRVAALREAVTAYEAVVREYPGHAKARHNLDHVRFLLKRLLQNPPETPPEQQQCPPKEKPKTVSVFTRAWTEVSDAKARILPDKTAVELIHPATGETPP